MRRRKSRFGLLLAITLFAAVFGFSTYKVIAKTISDKQAQQTFAALAAMKEQSAASETAPTPTPLPIISPEPKPEIDSDIPFVASPEPSATPEPEPTPLPEYALLYETNPEFFGWLTIEAVGIDYPVMYSPTRSEYYLNRDFYGKYSDSGIPFIDGRCPENGNYYLIYGHLMQNKTVFGRLPSFADETFWQENPTFRFDTVYEKREYAILAAFYTRLYAEAETGVFRYYKYFDLSDPAVFEEYVSQVKRLSLYDTGIDAEYGDELLVLSTCSHHTTEGRFVVVAMRIK